MGIVSSAFGSLALQIAWNCQRLLDPRYRCVEEKREFELSPPSRTPEATEQKEETTRRRILRTSVKSATFPRTETGKSVYQENRSRRARQLRHRKRPSSFDASLIVSGRSNNQSVGSVQTRLVTSQSGPPQGQPTRFWEMTSSSGCSSDSGSYLDSDSETDLRICEMSSEKPEDVEARKEIGMSAAEEAAFRMTVGRGHFTRSKKDKFLNHLRLEKRLNDMNKEFFEVACLSDGRTSARRHSGDLHRIV